MVDYHSEVWRIRTFAIDHDVHNYQISSNVNDAIDLAIKTTNDNFGDIISSSHILEIEDFTNPDEVKKLLSEYGLEPNLDVTPLGCIFWTPDTEKYRTKSKPK